MSGWLARWRDFVDAGLHVAAATDAPWILPDFELTDDIGRPVDQIAGGMDGRGRSEPGDADVGARPAADRRAGAAGGDPGRGLRLGDEARRGHLAPGTLGDVTILSGDVTRRHAGRDPGDDG